MDLCLVLDGRCDLYLVVVDDDDDDDVVVVVVVFVVVVVPYNPPTHPHDSSPYHPYLHPCYVHSSCATSKFWKNKNEGNFSGRFSVFIKGNLRLIILAGGIVLTVKSLTSQQ
jgi:hypothetical protein